MTTPVITKMQELYYQLRDVHVAHGNIVAEAEDRALEGRYEAAIESLAGAENSDFITDKVAFQVAIELAKLGDGPDAVADALRARGIKGSQGETCSCPLANFISGLPGIDAAEVLDGHVTVWPSDSDGAQLDVDLPVGAAEFVWWFDNGDLYLDLVDLGAVA